MTDDWDPEPSIAVESIVSLLADWERARVGELAQKVIHRLSRIKAAGLFAEHNYTSVWGEYSHSVQTGAYPGFSEILGDMAEDACEIVAENVPPHEMKLFDWLAQVKGDVEGSSGMFYLIETLKDEVSSRASIRNLERYSSDYRWYEDLW